MLPVRRGASGSPLPSTPASTGVGLRRPFSPLHHRCAAWTVSPLLLNQDPCTYVCAVCTYILALTINPFWNLFHPQPFIRGWICSAYVQMASRLLHMCLRTLYYIVCSWCVSIYVRTYHMCIQYVQYVSICVCLWRTSVTTVCDLCWAVTFAVILEFTYVCMYMYVCFLICDGV